MNICGRGLICCRQSVSILIGLCMGITLSIVLTPFLEEDCFLFRGRNMHLSYHESRSQADQAKASTVDEYIPRITTRNKPKSSEQREKVIRPRHYSAELGLKEKIFVAVFSSKDTISSYGVALNTTLSHHVDKVVFFINAADKKQVPRPLQSMTVVGFPNNRPILKPFHILRYLGDNYANDFDFFFFLNDDTYVRAWELARLAARISVANNVYLGKKIEEENALYCKLSAGFLLSRTSLLPVLRNLDWCTRNAFSDSIDDNLGRCILHSTNVPCMERVQGQEFASHNFVEDDSREKILNLLENKRLSHILTVSSIKLPKTFYELHRIFAELDVIETQQAISNLESQIMEIKSKNPKKSDFIWPLGTNPPYIVKNRFDIIHWQYFTLENIFLTSDFENFHRLEKSELTDLQLVVNASITTILKENEHLTYRRLINGYRRFDPTRGMEYLIDTEFQDRISSESVRKRVEAVRPLGDIEMISVPFVTENTRVTLVLKVDVNNREDTSRFINNYVKVCMENQDNTALMVAFIYDPRTISADKKDIFAHLKTSINENAKKFQNRGSKISWMSMRSTGLKLSEFGFMDLVVRKYSSDTLLLFCHSGMEIRAEYLNRVRMNTIKRFQVFAPIPFVQYHPDIVYRGKKKVILEVNKKYGHFDDYNFDHLSFYTKDYLSGRKSIESEVPIVKLDKDLKNIKHQRLLFGIYEMFANMSNLHILRAVEPALLCHFQLKSCISTLTEAAHHVCLMSRHMGLASRSQLAELYTMKRAFLLVLGLDFEFVI
uniref:Hexosyltransferase n=1 Tax=Strigamia maritima TaxID=126957 RepID=T1J8E4_STRMM